MTTHLTNHLPYPHDRYNGFVQLTDGNGNLYLTDFVRSYDTGTEAGNAMKFSGAFLVISRRIQNQYE